MDVLLKRRMVHRQHKFLAFDRQKIEEGNGFLMWHLKETPENDIFRARQRQIIDEFGARMEDKEDMKLFERENIIVTIGAMMQVILQVLRGIHFHTLVIKSFLLITRRVMRQCEIQWHSDSKRARRTRSDCMDIGEANTSAYRSAQHELPLVPAE
jgi:hypothetical protein